MSTRSWCFAVLLALLPLPLRAVTISNVRPVAVPAAIEFALDVRWSGDDSLLVAAGREGVLKVDVGKPKLAETIVAGGATPRVSDGPVASFFFSALLGSSADYLVAGSPFRAFAWRAAATGAVFDAPFANIVDLDVHRDRAIILGVRGDAAGRWGAVGATLWSVTLAPQRVFFNALTGPDVPLMRACHLLSMGSVRFLPDGRFVVAPGVDRGVFLYDAQGRVIRHWSTTGLGYDDRCTVTVEQADAFADLEPRRAWQNRRQLLDEMVVLPEGPLLIIREPADGATRWRGVLLPYEGKPLAVPIPLRSPSPYAHVRADVRGAKIVLSLFESRSPDEPRRETRSLFIGTIRR